MTTHPLNPPSLRLPAILLLLTPLPFLGVFAAGLFGFVNKVTTSFDKITPEVMASITVPWVMIFVFTFTAQGLGIIATGVLSNQLKTTNAHSLTWLILIAVVVNLVIGVINVYLRVTMVDFTEPTLGQTPQWEISHTLVYVFHLINFATLVLIGVGLYLSGWLRRTGLVVSVLSGLLFIAGLVPSITDRTPPFIFVFFWLALGIGLLRRRAV